jgi:hypothetical protein
VSARPRFGARPALVVVGLAIAVGIAVTSFAFGPRGDPSDTGPGDPVASYVAGERVLVFYDGKFYPGRVLSVKERSYQVRYEGFSTSWNEWVTGRRLKKAKGE